MALANQEDSPQAEAASANRNSMTSCSSSEKDAGQKQHTVLQKTWMDGLKQLRRKFNSFALARDDFLHEYVQFAFGRPLNIASPTEAGSDGACTHKSVLFARVIDGGGVAKSFGIVEGEPAQLDCVWALTPADKQSVLIGLVDPGYMRSVLCGRIAPFQIGIGAQPHPAPFLCEEGHIPKCAACGEMASSKCSVCRTMYCSASCQRKHWSIHKRECQSLARQRRLSHACQSILNASDLHNRKNTLVGYLSREYMGCTLHVVHGNLWSDQMFRVIEKIGMSSCISCDKRLDGFRWRAIAVHPFIPGVKISPALEALEAMCDAIQAPIEVLPTGALSREAVAVAKAAGFPCLAIGQALEHLLKEEVSADGTVTRALLELVKSFFGLVEVEDGGTEIQDCLPIAEWNKLVLQAVDALKNASHRFIANALAIRLAGAIPTDPIIKPGQGEHIVLMLPTSSAAVMDCLKTSPFDVLPDAGGMEQAGALFGVMSGLRRVSEHLKQEGGSSPSLTDYIPSGNFVSQASHGRRLPVVQWDWPFGIDLKDLEHVEDGETEESQFTTCDSVLPQVYRQRGLDEASLGTLESTFAPGSYGGAIQENNVKMALDAMQRSLSLAKSSSANIGESSTSNNNSASHSTPSMFSVSETEGRATRVQASSSPSGVGSSVRQGSGIKSSHSSRSDSSLSPTTTAIPPASDQNSAPLPAPNPPVTAGKKVSRASKGGKKKGKKR